MIDPAHDATVIGYLTAAFTRLSALLIYIDEMRADVSSAHDLAVKEGKPTVQIRFFQDELDALRNIAGDQILPLLHKLAEVETGSQG